jgi:hypothetical protein
MSASSIDNTAFIYKRVYSGKKPEDIALRDHVWFAMCPREGEFTGLSFSYPVRYGNPQAISGTASTAITNGALARSSSKGAQFRALRTAKYGVVTIDGQSAAASKGSKGAWFDLVTMETDKVLEEMGDRLAFDFYRDTYCLRGRGATAAGNVITLAEPTDARNFKVGMTIVSDNSSDGGSLNGGSTYVVAVNHSAGTVTMEDVTDISGFAQTDYLFCEGDPGTGMQGLEVCTPLSAPVYGTDSFRDVDRGQNADLLAGCRLDDTSLNAEQVIGRLAVAIANNGRSHAVDQAFMHPTHFYNMTSRLGAKVEYTDGGGTANYGFEHVWVHTAAGRVRAYSDPDCPITRVRVSREGSQYIKHLDGLPHIFDLDGKPVQRQATSNGIEARVEAFCNLIQDDTAAQGVGSLAAS